MKRAPQDPEPEFFITDLTALNKLYQAAKRLFTQPSLATHMALKLTIQEAEQPFFSREFFLSGEARNLRELALETTWPSDYQSRR